MLTERVELRSEGRMLRRGTISLSEDQRCKHTYRLDSDRRVYSLTEHRLPNRRRFAASSRCPSTNSNSQNKRRACSISGLRFLFISHPCSAAGASRSKIGNKGRAEGVRAREEGVRETGTKPGTRVQNKRNDTNPHKTR